MEKPAFDRNQPLLTEEEVQERRHILVAGIEQFHAGYFFQAHEPLDELCPPRPGPFRPFLPRTDSSESDIGVSSIWVLRVFFFSFSSS